MHFRDLIACLTSGRKFTLKDANESTLQVDIDSLSAPLGRKKLSEDAEKHQRNRHFIDVNAKDQKFRGFDFSYSVFERVYFRNATFDNCKFVGCRFKDCNFRNATFLFTDLSYCDFNRCIIDAREIAASLPTEPNTRTESLQNVRANALSTGDIKTVSFLVLEEVKASKEHYRRALLGEGDYYRKKYPGVLERSRAALKLVYYWLNNVIWGYGEKPLSMLFSLVGFLCILSFVNAWAVLPHMSWQQSGYGTRILRYSFETFLNIRPDAAFSGYRWVDYVLGSLRYIYAGLFVTSLVRSISHR